MEWVVSPVPIRVYIVDKIFFVHPACDCCEFYRDIRSEALG